MSFSKLVQKVKSEIAFYKGLAKDTEGASGIEYAIVAAMVAVVIAGLSTGMGTSITTLFGTISTALIPKP
ncbi:Flp family type IVb pilin [Pseudomonas sp. SDO5532_S415]|jgi:pilus assembly protein Flp/PilA|uniref:Flp family type IVb pilin n=1 Tax=Pseudomonas sp. Irchel 3A7 TaxID=2008913 RepID=UPI000BA36F1E|nr:Flp family type IVb pilin [Pseudomonas sp. Irchel 3A7]